VFNNRMREINKIDITFLFSVILLIFTLLGQFATNALYNSDSFVKIDMLVKHQITQNNRKYVLYTLKNQIYTTAPFYKDY